MQRGEMILIEIWNGNGALSSTLAGSKKSGTVMIPSNMFSRSYIEHSVSILGSGIVGFAAS